MWNNQQYHHYNTLRRYFIANIVIAIVLVAVLLQSYSVSAATAPRQVTKLTVVEVTTESVKLRWQHQRGVKKYHVRLLDADDGVLSTVVAKKRLKTITELTPDTTYGAQVRAVKGSKKGPWSSKVEFVTEAEPEDDGEEDLYEKYSVVNGTYSGGWNNLTYSTSGDTEAVVVVQPDGNASFVLDLGGMVFGMFDPDSAIYSSTYDADGIVFTATEDPVFGTLTITVVVNDDGTANVTLDAQNVPTAGIETVIATGTLTENAIDMEYTIGFILGASANGTFTLEKQ